MTLQHLRSVSGGQETQFLLTGNSPLMEMVTSVLEARSTKGKRPARRWPLINLRKRLDGGLKFNLPHFDSTVWSTGMSYVAADISFLRCINKERRRKAKNPRCFFLLQVFVIPLLGFRKCNHFSSELSLKIQLKEWWKKTNQEISCSSGNLRSQGLFGFWSTG